MQPVLQVHLEITNARLWPRGIQLARTIQTFDARVVHVFEIRGRGFSRADTDGHVGGCGDGCVAHCSFEEVVRVGLLEFGEGLA